MEGSNSAMMPRSLLALPSIWPRIRPLLIDHSLQIFRRRPASCAVSCIAVGFLEQHEATDADRHEPCIGHDVDDHYSEVGQKQDGEHQDESEDAVHGFLNC